VSENRSPDVAEVALEAGGGGYVLKSDAARELLPAINAILEGKRFISAALAGHFIFVGVSIATQMFSWLSTLL
jgi:DNA-binding NarL/FixJ family response regulator